MIEGRAIRDEVVEVRSTVRVAARDSSQTQLLVEPILPHERPWHFPPEVIVPKLQRQEKTMSQTTFATLHKTVEVDGLDIFYREAGPESAPTILLLHGFPTSSHT